MRGLIWLSLLLASPAWAQEPPPNPAFETAETFWLARDAYEAGDYDKAADAALAAAAAGDTDAAALLGLLYARGLGVAQDDDAAVAWWREAAEADQADALNGLADMALNARGGFSPSDAPGFLERAAQNGDGLAQRRLADILSIGGFAPRDPARAGELYAQAASSGDAEAAYSGAILLIEGADGLEPQVETGVALLRQAAENRLAPAMADYGLMLYQGRGLEPDVNEAAVWFERAAEAGDQEGQYLYAFALLKGEGVEKDLEAGFGWLLRSMGQGPATDPVKEAERQRLARVLTANLPPDAVARARAFADDRPAPEPALAIVPSVNADPD
ncbi:MAG: tetratricopeptide repeat protein [Maricaulaceae bacterium]